MPPRLASQKDEHISACMRHWRFKLVSEDNELFKASGKQHMLASFQETQSMTQEQCPAEEIEYGKAHLDLLPLFFP